MLPKLERSAERMTERGKWKEGGREREQSNKKMRKCEERKAGLEKMSSELESSQKGEKNQQPGLTRRPLIPRSERTGQATRRSCRTDS